MPDFLVRVNLQLLGDKQMARPKTFLAFRGRDRKAIHKLAKALQQVKDLDQRRQTAAATAGTVATLFSVRGELNVAAGMTTLQTRCTNALEQKESLRQM